MQKSAFLAAEEGVELSVFFQKKFGAGLFGGEGIFNTVVKGPGRIILQTMPVNKVAGSILPYIPSSGT
ncbi:MAG: AIM24 family protein [Anaerovoracaceae bacterium]